MSVLTDVTKNNIHNSQTENSRFECSFETDDVGGEWCLIQQSDTDTFDWTRNNGSTPSGTVYYNNLLMLYLKYYLFSTNQVYNAVLEMSLKLMKRIPFNLESLHRSRSVNICTL